MVVVLGEDFLEAAFTASPMLVEGERSTSVIF